MRWTCLATPVLFCSSVLFLSVAEAADSAATETEEGFTVLFDGKNLDNWQGAVEGYTIEDGAMVCKPGGNIYAKKEYKDFIFRFEFLVPPGGNNGVGIRTPKGVDSAYGGMEIQILDDEHEKYKGWLAPYQVHGSIYGVVPAKRGALKPAGQWNSEEIVAKGSHIKVTVNGTVVVDADIADIKETVDHREHPGLHNEKGLIGFLGHGDPVSVSQRAGEGAVRKG